jgi:DNA-binding PadR family transcriptional regulator
MSQGLPTTSYALLGLLTFGDELTGYELKQRADRTLRFYWVAPAMSQVYTELGRLADLGLVRPRDTEGAGRSTRRYQITAKGRRTLTSWLSAAPTEFPELRHPVALRLLMGHLVEPATSRRMLEDYLTTLEHRRAELQLVRDSLRVADEPGQRYHFPAMVADWGLEYYDSERTVVEKLRSRLGEE